MKGALPLLCVLIVWNTDLFAQVQLQNPELAVSIIVTDSARAKEFYHECLGLRYNGSQSVTGMKMLLFGSGQATIKVRVYNTDPPERNPSLLASNGIRFVSIPVPAFDSAIARLGTKGYPAPLIRTENAVRTAMTKDSEGNEVELVDAITSPVRKLEIGLLVANPDSATLFYSTVLGFTAAPAITGPSPLPNAPEYRYRANNTVLRYFSPTGNRPTFREGVASSRGYRYITFTVAKDVDILYQHLIDFGYSMASPLAPYGTAAYLFMVWGPGGAIHEFIGPKHVEAKHAFADMVFSADYYAPGLPSGDDVSKTLEANALENHQGKIYCATTYAGPAGDPATSDPKILVKESANGAWRIDYKGGSKFVRFPIIKSVNFTSDGNGKPLSPPVPVLVCGTGAWHAWNPDGVYVLSRNDNTNQWVQHKLSDKCWNATQTNKGCEVRMIFDHRDRVTGVHYVFAGAYNGALYRGWYDASQPGLIAWDPVPEIDSLLGHVLCAAAIEDTIFLGMSFGEGSGNPAPLKDYGLWKRIDGVRKPVVGHGYNPNDDLQWRWIRIPAWENPNVPGEHLRRGQLRGLTAIPDPKGGVHQVLAFHWDNPNCSIETVDPRNGYAHNIELNTRDFIRTLWNNSTAGMITAGYNDWLPAIHPDTKERVHLIGAWAMYPGGEITSPEGKSSWLFVRSSDGTYSLVRIWDFNNPLTNATNGLKGCRSIRPSPFAEESGRVWYFSGFDLTGEGTTSVAGSKAWIYKGSINRLTSIENENSEIPAALRLHQNFPNPFNPTTVIGFELSTSSHVSLIAYDLLGRQIAVLVNEWKQPGTYQVPFSILDSRIPSGVYFYQLKAGHIVKTKKMIVLQ